jgi:ATP/ADP translocase/HEAT repeat protein
MGASARQLQRLLTSLLRIRAGEGRKTGLMFGVMLCAVGTFITGRVARDALFLTRYSVDYLPYLYLWIGLGVSVQSYLFSRIVDRFRRDRLLKVSLAVMAGLFLLARLALLWVGDWFYPLLYVLVELIGSMLVIQAWTLANEIFDTRQAKRLFGVVGAGGVISSVVVGFAIRGSIKWMGTENLLFVCAGLLIVCLWLVHRVSAACREELLANLTGMRRNIRARISLFSDWKRIFAHRHLVFVAGLVAALVMVMTFVDWQFKVTARYAYLNREEQLAGFFGLFYGLTGVLNIFVQTLATGRILERFGILVSLLLLPLALTTGAVCWLAVPALWSATLLKGADATLRYTVNDATVQLLYLPVPSHVRGRAKAFVDGIIRPLAIGLAGICLAWLTPLLPARAFGWIVLALLFIWITLTFAVRREYLSSLVNTLRSRRLDLDIESSLVPDQAASQALRRALEDRDEQNVLHALEMIPYTSRTDWGEPLVDLSKHRSPRVRAKAVSLLGELGSLQHGPVVHARLRDRNPDVVAAAIDAYCSIGRERAVRTITSFLEHDSQRVRSAAVVGLIRYGGLDGVLSSAEQLKNLLESDAAEERAAGARILGKIQVKNFYHPLLRLMADSEPEVRRAAIWAAGRMQSPELMPALIYRTESPATRTPASEALVAIGPLAVPLLRRVLANRDESLSARSAVPPILARIGDQAAMDALQTALAAGDPRLRGCVLEGVHRLRLRRPHLKVDTARVNAALRDEVANLYHHATLQADLDLDPQSLLADVLAQRRRETVGRIFRLLGCLYPVRPVDAVLANLASVRPHARANALEVLDNLLDKGHKRWLLPALDPSLQQEQEAIGSEVFGLQHRPRRRWLADLITDSDPWLATCAIHEAGLQTAGELLDPIAERTTADDPLVRETALLVLSRLAPAERWRPTAERHLRDPARQVRRLARWLCRAAEPAPA